MNDCDKKLFDLIEYIELLLNNDCKIYNRINKGHIKKINKLLRSFCKEYLRKEWGWK